MRINKDINGFISINGLSFPKVNTSGNNINFAIEESNPKIRVSFSNGIKIAEANFENITFKDEIRSELSFDPQLLGDFSLAKDLYDMGIVRYVSLSVLSPYFGTQI